MSLNSNVFFSTTIPGKSMVAHRSMIAHGSMIASGLMIAPTQEGSRERASVLHSSTYNRVNCFHYSNCSLNGYVGQRVLERIISANVSIT